MSVASSPSTLALTIESVLRRGWVETVRWMLAERAFDRERGIETFARIPVAKLFPRGGRAALAASEYQPVPVRLFRAALAQVPAEARALPFLDLGCGKGRALVLAAEAGFRRLRGVDLATSLVDVARANLAITAERLRESLDVRIDVGDAHTWPFEHDEGTLFLFHPFGARAMRRVARAVAASVATHPRTVWIVYVNPVHGSVFADTPGFREHAVGRTRMPGTLDWVVFEAVG